MEVMVQLNTVYAPSDDVVAREIEGQLIIVPLISGVGDMEEELFTLNETGRAIWSKLDGKRKLKDVVRELSCEFDDPGGEIEADVIGLVRELLRRRMVIEA